MSAGIVAVTDRLLLREITGHDAQHAYLLNLDPDVIRYTGDESFQSVAEAAAFLEKYDHYQKYGFGRWAVIEKEQNEFIGWCGLKFHEDENFCDLGFRFFKNRWGHGYATESAQKCLELGFIRFGLPEIIGKAAKENSASIHVLKKLGMQLISEGGCHGQDAFIFSMTRQAFLETHFSHT